MQRKAAAVDPCAPPPEQRAKRAFMFERSRVNSGQVRYRVKPVLTTLERRRDIIAAVAEQTAEFQKNSLKNRLTKLDRALSDYEAAALERLLDSINGVGNIGSVDHGKVGGGSCPWARSAISDHQAREIKGKVRFLATLTGVEGLALSKLAAWSAADYAGPKPSVDEAFIWTMQHVAARAVIFYQEFDGLLKKKKH